MELLVELPPVRDERPPRSVGASTRFIGGAQLVAGGNSTALESVLHFVPNTFEVDGPMLVLRTRAGALAAGIEPVLVLDGIPMPGFVANTLASLRSADLRSIEVRVGSVAGWHIQSRGAPAVIEVTTRSAGDYDYTRRPESCPTLDGPGW